MLGRSKKEMRKKEMIGEAKRIVLCNVRIFIRTQ